MGDSPLILPGVTLTRITPPPPTPHFLLRERLIERINRPAPRSTFAVAPGGFGKSVLASQWAARIDGPVFWYNIDARDSARDSIFHIIQGLRRVLPNFAPWAEELVTSDLDYVEITRKLANDLGRIDQMITLIWDGVDQFSPEFTPALQAFAEMSPLNIRTLSLRTSMPVQSFARAAKLDALDFLTAVDLRFNESELRAILAQHDLDYADPEVRRIFDDLQGWPAGIQMLINRQSNKETPVSQKMTESLIVAATVQSISERDREYLEHLIFIEEITFDIAQRLNHSPIISSEDHPLLRLSNQGVFLTEVERGIFKINPMIKEELLRGLSANRTAFLEYAMKSAALLEEKGNPIGAIEVYGLIEADDLVAKKSLHYMSRIINGGDIALLEKWLARIAPLINLGGTTALNEDMLRTYIELMKGNNLEVLALCNLIESNFPTISSPEKYIVEIRGLRVRALFNLGRFQEVIAITEEMLASADSKSEYGSAGIRVTNVLRLAASVAFLREDYDGLIRYASLIEYPEDTLVTEVIATATQSLVALAEGRFKRAFDFAHVTQRATIAHNIVGVYGSFDSAYVLAEYNRESGEEVLALEILDNFESLALRHKVWPWYVAYRAKRALIYASANRASEALNILRSARERLAGSEFDPEIFRILDEHELLIRVKLNDTERIGELLYRMSDTPTTIAFKKTYSALANPSSAQAILDEYPSANPRTELIKALISAEVYKKYPHEALEHLKRAVDLAMAQGAKAIFLNQSPEVQHLLLTLANNQPTIFMEQLAMLVRKNQADSLRGSMGLREHLTKRELDILRRLSTGLPITQIASSLHISHNTIKTHLKNVYRKIGVESRSEAIERAVELFLL